MKERLVTFVPHVNRAVEPSKISKIEVSEVRQQDRQRGDTRYSLRYCRYIYRLVKIMSIKPVNYRQITTGVTGRRNLAVSSRIMLSCFYYLDFRDFRRLGEHSST
jgi:hypothetical protein